MQRNHIHSQNGINPDKLPGLMTLISLAITVAFSYSLAISLGLVEGVDFWWELGAVLMSLSTIIVAVNA